MARVSNARSSHVEKWVVPAARELLIQEACKDVPTKHLDEVAFIDMGQSPDGNSVNRDGAGMPFVGGPADLGIEFPETSRWTTTPTKLSQPDDIIVCVRATIGEPRWSDGVYCLGRGVAGVRPKDGKIDRRFLFRIIQANERVLSEKGTGTTFKTITKDHLARIEVPILSPETQKMIGEYLEWLESHSKTRPDFSIAPKLPDFLRHASATVVHIESLAARVNDAQRLREEASEEADKYLASAANEIFTELAEKHSPIPIGNSFSFRQDLIRPTDGKSGKIRFIGLQHVESGTGRRIGEDTLDAAQLTGRKFHFSPGEIVYGYLRPYLNKVWIADCEGVCSVDQYVIRPNEKIINTVYLAHFMRSPVFLHRAIELTHNLLLPRLRTRLLESILIPVPSLDEQQRIVTYLDDLQAKVNALRKLQSTSREELSALMPSILDKAFRGEL